MNVISIKLLKSLIGGQKETNELLNLLGIKKAISIYNKKSCKEDYIEKKYSDQIKEQSKLHCLEILSSRLWVLRRYFVNQMK